MGRLILVGVLLSVLSARTKAFRDENQNSQKFYKDIDDVWKCPMPAYFAGENRAQILHVTGRDIYFYEGDDVEILIRINISSTKNYRMVWQKIRHGKVTPLLDAVAEEQTTDSVVLEKLKIFSCNEKCAADYLLEVKSEKDVLQCYSWHAMQLEKKPRVEINVDSWNLDTDNNCVLWNESVVVKCVVGGGKIEDLKMQEKWEGEESWSDVDPKALKVIKKTDCSELQYIFLAKSPLSLRCMNVTDGKEWSVDISLTGITDPTIEERNEDGTIILDCIMPMTYTGSIYWQKNDEAIGPEEPRIENYMKIYSVNTSIFHPSWGEFVCISDDEDLTHEVCKGCS